MGLLKDVIDLGLTDFTDSGQLAEFLEDEFGYNWSEMGYDTRHYGEVEDLQRMMEEFYFLGFDDLGDKAFEQWEAAISYYEEAYGYEIYYNPADKRWHDSETHRYVKDPYEWIRD